MSRNTGTSISQAQTIGIATPIFREHYPECRFIKIHGGKYSEKGLPDWMILTWTETYWLEIKNAWDDYPKQLQYYNITNLKQVGFYTGILVGAEIKFHKYDKIYKLDKAIQLIKKQQLSNMP